MKKFFMQSFSTGSQREPKVASSMPALYASFIEVTHARKLSYFMFYLPYASFGCWSCCRSSWYKNKLPFILIQIQTAWRRLQESTEQTALQQEAPFLQPFYRAANTKDLSRNDRMMSAVSPEAVTGLKDSEEQESKANSAWRLGKGLSARLQGQPWAERHCLKWTTWKTVSDCRKMVCSCFMILFRSLLIWSCWNDKAVGFRPFLFKITVMRSDDRHLAASFESNGGNRLDLVIVLIGIFFLRLFPFCHNLVFLYTLWLL